MSRSVLSGIRNLYYAYRHCDEYEHIECDMGHEHPPDYDGAECVRCGRELKVRVERKLMVRLALGDIKMATVPYRLYDFSIDTPTNEARWLWRGRTIWTYERENPFYDPELAAEIEAEREAIRQSAPGV